MDHAQTTSLAFASPPVCPPELSEAPGPGDDVSSFGFSSEVSLESAVVIIA